MGNAATSLPYEIGSAQDYKGNMHWQLNTGHKKAEGAEEVSIFRFSKSQSDKIALAQRSVQKLRTLKHPSVLAFVDSTDLEDQLILVTEYCIPLDVYLGEQLANTVTQEDRTQLFDEALWGCKCILTALAFLHTVGNMTHGYLGPHAIFVCKTGDWKLGAFDLATNSSIAAESAIAMQHGHLLAAPFQAPERKVMNDSALRHPVGSADIFSLAQIMLKLASDIGLTLPSTTAKLFQRMAMPEPQKRPTAETLLNNALFNSEHLALLASLGDLAIKPTAESISILSSLAPKLASLPKPVCVYKIVPAVSRVLQMAFNDFPNRDSREASRQAIDQGLILLSELARLKKVDETVFNNKCVPILCSLWPLSDRSVRTSLLKTCKHIIPLVPALVFNKSMFEAMLAGFSDSNAKMREETLKNLVYVVDKLDEKHLQDKLVRCITSLQGDAEASIRTNVTIFLGKIAGKLKESTRNKMLCSSFLKAMRDNFMHCRIAGLKAAIACLSMLEVGQLSKSLMPQLCILLLDRHAEVRELSMQLLENCLPLMRKEMARLTELEQSSKQRGGPEGSGAAGQGSDGNAAPATTAEATSATASFLSWAVDGLAKAAIASAGPQSQSAEIPKPVTSSSSSSARSSSSSSSSTNRSVKSMSLSGQSTSKQQSQPVSKALPVSTNDFEDWDESTGGDIDIDIPDEDLLMDDDNDTSNKHNSNNKVNSSSNKDDGWGDDDFDVDDDEEDSGNKYKSNNNTGKPGTLGIVSKTSAPAAAVASKSAWDDDDDLFDNLEVKIVEQKLPKSKSTERSEPSTPTPPPPPPASSASPGMSLSSTSSRANTTNTTIGGLKPSTSTSSISSSGSGSASKSGKGSSAAAATTTTGPAGKKAAVTKLAMDPSDNSWDDF